MQKRRNHYLSKYGDRVSFLNRHSPDKQITLCADEKVAILDESPTLTDLNITYGGNTAVMFLIPQLFNMSEFCGAKDKFTDRQIEETAQLIVCNYPWLKVLEMMTFCKRFKSGVYGRFYGAVDPMVIMCALRDFLEYRNDVYADYERYKNIQKIEEESRQPRITYEEYKRQKEEELQRRRDSGEEISEEEELFITEDKLNDLKNGRL